MKPVGMMDEAYFVGRRELLGWLNATLDLDLQKVEETCTGAAACQLLDRACPGTVNLAKVDWAARDASAAARDTRFEM